MIADVMIKVDQKTPSAALGRTGTLITHHRPVHGPCTCLLSANSAYSAWLDSEYNGCDLGSPVWHLPLSEAPHGGRKHVIQPS